MSEGSKLRFGGKRLFDMTYHNKLNSIRGDEKPISPFKSIHSETIGKGKTNGHSLDDNNQNHELDTAGQTISSIVLRFDIYDFFRSLFIIRAESQEVEDDVLSIVGQDYLFSKR